MSHIDPFFREQLRNHEIQPGESAWERIQAATQAKKERRLGFWIPAVAAGLAIVVVSSVAILRQSGNAGQAQGPLAAHELRTSEQKGQEEYTAPLTKGTQDSNPAQIAEEAGLQSKTLAQSNTPVPADRTSRTDKASALQSRQPKTGALARRAEGSAQIQGQSVAQTETKVSVERRNTDFMPLPLNKPMVTTAEDFEEVAMMSIPLQEIAALSPLEAKAENQQDQVRIQSFITSKDLIEAADDTPRVISQGRKWLQLAERKVESLAQQIKLPINLTSIDQIEVHY